MTYNNINQNKVAFFGVKCTSLYLVTYPNNPLMYPRQHHTDINIVKFSFSATEVDILPLPNNLNGHVGSGISSSLIDRLTYKSYLFTFLGTLVSWKSKNGTRIMCDLTRGKLSSLFDGVCVGKTIQNYTSSLGKPLPLPTLFNKDNRSEISDITDSCLTTFAHHDDMPICWMHEQRNRGIFDLR